ncbi:MAG: folate-binding protein [Hyphomicrobiales bacterium]
MASAYLSQLRNRTIIALGGEEATAFLQRLLTVDMNAITHDHVGYGALLTPQGKILFDVFILKTQNRILLDCARRHKNDVIKRLSLYKLRAKVEIEDRSDDDAVAALWGDGGTLKMAEKTGAMSQIGPIWTYRDPRSLDAGIRFVVPRGGIDRLADTFTAEFADESTYKHHRITLGLADMGEDVDRATLFPHEANFDQFGGVDFTKGCYIGQEVVSRMQHRATIRKRIVPVRFDGMVPADDSDIAAGGTIVGQLLCAVESHGLALLRLDRVAKAFAASESLTIQNTVLKMKRPTWAHFAIPGVTPS